MLDINENLHIKDYLFILQRRKWIIVAFFVITVTTVVIVTFIQKKVYMATATVIVDSESPDILSVKEVVKLGETNYFAYRDYIETQQEIIRSRRTAYQVMRNLKFADNKEFRDSKDPIERLLQKLHVELVRDTRILKISAYDNNPKSAALIANEFARVFAGSNIALKIKTSTDAHKWLEDEVDKQKRKVQVSELKLQEYKENNDIGSFENQQGMVNDGLIKLNSSYLDAQKRRIQLESAYKSLLDKKQNLSLENLPSILAGNVTIQELKQNYLKQETLLVEYTKVYKDKHPKMISLMENISHLKSQLTSQIETEYNNALSKVETDYNNTLQEEKDFKKAVDEQKKRALELDRKIINYNVLKREVDTNERILDIVLNRLKETSISNQIQTNNVRVQDLAEAPRKPIKPRKSLNIALSFILGLIGGVTLAFFRDYMDTTLKNPVDISGLLQAPVLGTVPKIKTDGRNIMKKEDIDRIVEKDIHSLAAEAYRTIRTNLLFSLNHSSSSKSIVITSSIPGEGKTLTAVNLGMMIANSGEKVLLVDADMRKPRIHIVFNEENTLGLSQFLSGEEEFDNIVKYSGMDNLYIVTAGKPTEKPAELISSKNMKLFLDKASSRFSKIIFDTPPVTLVTDAQIMSSISTGVILIAERGRITKELLSRSKELLEKVDAKILGVIINNSSLTQDTYSYPTYYYGKFYSPAAKD